MPLRLSPGTLQRKHICAMTCDYRWEYSIFYIEYIFISYILKKGRVTSPLQPWTWMDRWTNYTSKLNHICSFTQCYKLLLSYSTCLCRCYKSYRITSVTVVVRRTRCWRIGSKLDSNDMKEDECLLFPHTLHHWWLLKPLLALRPSLMTPPERPMFGSRE